MQGKRRTGFPVDYGLEKWREKMLLPETESAVEEVILSGKSEAWLAEYIAGFAEVVKKLAGPLMTRKRGT